ncbi:MAG: MFS transporter [Clostridiales bacterium]|nr:MFS transporter [Clostridiales bacterium]
MVRFKALIKRNQLVDTLINLRGNARACVYTEPLWGIPTTLYLPLVAKYMEALGLTPLQIGIVATLSILSQMVFAPLSGAITDKFGRRWTTTIVDAIAWCLPLLIWMGAQGFGWFVVAALLNGTWRITENSWGLLMVEDAPAAQLVNIYALANIAGLISGFVAPLTSILVARHSLVSTMRALYLFAAVSIGIKIIILHFMVKETEIGEQKKAELKGKHFRHALQGSMKVLRHMFSKRPLMLVLGIISCVMVIRSATDNFWPLFITGSLGIAEESLPLLSGLRSLAMLAAFFVLAPRIQPQRFHRPLQLGLVIMAALHLVLFLLPAGSGWVVFPGVVAEALALSMLIPLFSSLQMLLMDKVEKARMFGFSLAFCLMVTAPFGTINGLLSKWNLALPMLLSAALAVLALYFVHLLKKSLEHVRLDEA